MRVAVTGATGLIGKETVSLLQSSGFSILALGRNKEKLDNLLDSAIDKVATQYAVDELVNILYKVDAVIHLAAARPITEEEFSFFNNGNILLTDNLIHACQKVGINVFCYASSISVYSTRSRTPFKETHLPQPDSTYGISKLTCEHLVNLYRNTVPARAFNLRLAKAFGLNAIDERFFLYQFISQALRKEKITIWGSGQATRDLIYVKDIANAFLQFLNAENNSGTFNIGSGHSYSIVEIAKTVNSVFGNEGNLEIQSWKPDDKSQLCLDSTRAIEEMGWQAKWSLEAALIDIRDQMAINGNFPL